MTKKAHKKGQPINETPEGCYYTLLANHLELLSKECGFEVPALNSPDDYIEQGPPLHFLYHPGLGPLYQVIKQKLRGGILEKGSELQLEISALDIENLALNGSLRIDCKIPLGHLDEEGILRYSPRAPRCTLKNVKIENQGIDYSTQNIFWKNKIMRHESLLIKLGENSEFYAENVTFKGHHHLTVPDNTLLTATMEGEQVIFQTYHIQVPSWHWNYRLSEDGQSIVLEKIFS